MAIELLELLGTELPVEHWLARIDSALGVAHVFTEEEPAWTAEVARSTAPWLAFRHPRVVPLLALERAPRLVIAGGDERGVRLPTAARYLADRGIDREAWAVAELRALGEALAAMVAHVPGFVHGRASDEQIIVGPDGLARLRAPIPSLTAGPRRGYLGRGFVLARFDSHSPEQVRGVPVTAASDVYQLAGMLYRVLAGGPLVRGGSDFERLTDIVRGAVPAAPAVRTRGLGELVVRCLAKDPAARLPDASAFVRALGELDAGDPAPARAALAAWRPSAPPAPAPIGAITGERCARAWDALAPGAATDVRYCATCDQEVVRVRSIAGALPLLGRRCVAFSDDN